MTQTTFAGKKFSPEKLKALRKKKKLTLFALGTMSGINPSTISWWENNRSVPSIDNIFLVVHAMGRTLDDVME